MLGVRVGHSVSSSGYSSECLCRGSLYTQGSDILTVVCNSWGVCVFTTQFSTLFCLNFSDERFKTPTSNIDGRQIWKERCHCTGKHRDLWMWPLDPVIFIETCGFHRLLEGVEFDHYRERPTAYLDPFDDVSPTGTIGTLVMASRVELKRGLRKWDRLIFLYPDFFIVAKGERT